MNDGCSCENEQQVINPAIKATSEEQKNEQAHTKCVQDLATCQQEIERWKERATRFWRGFPYISVLC